MRNATTLTTFLLAGFSLGVGSLALVNGNSSTVAAKVVVSANDQQETESRSFVDLPGAATTITIPAGEKAIVVARFTGASQCGS